MCMHAHTAGLAVHRVVALGRLFEVVHVLLGLVLLADSNLAQQQRLLVLACQSKCWLVLVCTYECENSFRHAHSAQTGACPGDTRVIWSYWWQSRTQGQSAVA